MLFPLEDLCVSGVGKTTLVKNVCSQLRDMSVPLQGFYTEEVKEGGRRIGFDVVTLCGRRGPLARCRCHCLRL